jgi:protein-S-isoprenylcysteine O-methyltransferase Ste14
MIMTMRPLGGPSPVASQTVLVLFVAALLVDWVAGGGALWRPVRTDLGSFWLIQAGQLFAVVVGLFAPRWVPAANLPSWLWLVGALIMLIGAVIRTWSLRVLGGSFHRDVRVERGQTLVTSGPYRWVRHPSYTGALLLFAGLGIAQANVVSVVVLVVVPTAVYLRRIKIEEAALTTVLGDRYRSFAAHRARLLPWVY